MIINVSSTTKNRAAMTYRMGGVTAEDVKCEVDTCRADGDADAVCAENGAHDGAFVRVAPAVDDVADHRGAGRSKTDAEKYAACVKQCNAFGKDVERETFSIFGADCFT